MIEYKTNYIAFDAFQSMVTTISEFDFIKMQSIMDDLNWTWASCNGDVPEIADIMACAFDLLKTCYANYWKDNTNESQYCSTGGLEASYYYNEYENTHVFSLKFIVVESSNY